MKDKKLLRFIVLFYLFASFYSLVNAIIQKASGFRYGSISWSELPIDYLVNYGTKFIFILFCVRFTEKLIQRKTPIPLSIVIHTFLSIVLTVFSGIIMIVYERYILNLDENLELISYVSRIAYGFNHNFYVYFTIITIVYAYYYLQNQKNLQLKESDLKTQLLDSKISALQSQLQPHFLFNALNDISSLIEIDPQKSQEAIIDLSEMLRHTLNLKDQKFISLESEILLLKKYLDIERIRYDEKLKVHYDIDESLWELNVPPLLLQPIVENSIKHGFSYDHDTLEISIKAVKTDNYLHITIINNGKPLPEVQLDMGTGISNILKRLDTLYGKAFEFEICNLEGFVNNSIKIPMHV